MSCILAKLADLKRLEDLAADNPRTGLPWSGDASMIMRRLKVYQYTCRIPKPQGLKYCAHCFAKLLLNEGVVPGIQPNVAAPAGLTYV